MSSRGYRSSNLVTIAFVVSHLTLDSLDSLLIVLRLDVLGLLATGSTRLALLLGGRLPVATCGLVAASSTVGVRPSFAFARSGLLLGSRGGRGDGARSSAVVDVAIIITELLVDGAPGITEAAGDAFVTSGCEVEVRLRKVRMCES
jgi:hypothetical protein